MVTRPGPGPGPRPGPVRVWMLALRLPTLPAAVAPVVVGAALARALGVFQLLPALAALVGALLIQIATNLANDVIDARKGADTEARVGPVRVVQAGLLTEAAVWRATWGVMALALLVGVYLVSVGGWPILVVGILALFLAVGYTGGPFPLAYLGLGDLFAFLFFGPVAVAGTVWVQGRILPMDALWAGVGVGALVTAILVVNNLRDHETDRAAGKRTTAVRFGVGWTRTFYRALYGIAALVPVIGILGLGWSVWTLMAGVGLLRGRAALVRVLTFQEPRDLLPVLGGTARALTGYAALLALGFLAGAGG
jgi:1,4-dihydroxy-2-naphthoate polyprenyltransferase